MSRTLRCLVQNMTMKFPTEMMHRNPWSAILVTIFIHKSKAVNNYNRASLLRNLEHLLGAIGVQNFETTGRDKFLTPSKVAIYPTDNLNSSKFREPFTRVLPATHLRPLIPRPSIPLVLASDPRTHIHFPISRYLYTHPPTHLLTMISPYLHIFFFIQ